MRKSFTLIELLVVVAILAVLLGLLVPAVGQARRESWKSMCGSNLKNIGLAFDMYRGDYRDVYPCGKDPLFYATDTNKWIWLWMGRGWRSVLGPFIAPDLSADNPNVLWCPKDIAPRDQYTNTSYSYTMSFYHSPTQINQMKDPTWMYGNPPGKILPPVGIQSTRVVMPARKILGGEWFSNHRPVTGNATTEPGWWSRQGARNYLFADGHADFVPAEKIKPANDGNSNPGLTIDGVEGSDL